MKRAILIAVTMLMAPPALAGEDACQQEPEGEKRDLCGANMAAMASDAAPTDAKAAEEAANRHVELWSSYGRELCEKAPTDCATYADVLSDAARFFDRADHWAKAITVRRLLLKPQLPFAQSEAGKTAILQLAQSYERHGIFDRAAEYYARYERDAPKRDDARTMLARAIELRFLLGQTEAATEAAEHFAKRFPDSPHVTQHDIWHMRHLIHAERWKEASSVAKAVGARASARKRKHTLHEHALFSMIERGNGDAVAASKSVVAIRKARSSSTSELSQQARDDIAQAVLDEARAAQDPALTTLAASVGESPRWQIRAARLAGDLQRGKTQTMPAAALAAYQDCVSIARTSKLWTVDALVCEAALTTVSPRGRWRAPRPLRMEELLLPLLRNWDGTVIHP